MLKNRFYSTKSIIILVAINLVSSLNFSMDQKIPKDLISKLARENSTTNYLTQVTNIPEIQTLIAGYLDSNGYNMRNLEIEGVKKTSRAIAFSSDGKYIAIPNRGDDYRDYKISMYDIETKSKIYNLPLDQIECIPEIIFSSNDQHLVWNNCFSIFIYDISNRRYIHNIPDNSTRNICLSHDNLYFAYSHNNLLKIVDFDKLIKSKRLENISNITTTLEHKNTLIKFVFLRNNKNIISVEIGVGSIINNVNIWDISRLIPFRIKQFSEENVESLASGPYSNFFATATKDKIKIWDVANTKECRSTIKIDNSDISSILFSHNGKYLSVLFSDINTRNNYSVKSLKIFFFYNKLKNFCIHSLNEIEWGKMTYSPCGNYLLVGNVIFELINQSLDVLNKIKSQQDLSAQGLKSISTNNEMDLKHMPVIPFNENPKCIVCESANAKLKCKYECNTANYCSRDCKNTNWHEHLVICPNNPDSNKINNAKETTSIDRVNNIDDGGNGNEKRKLGYTMLNKPFRVKKYNPKDLRDSICIF